MPILSTAIVGCPCPPSGPNAPACAEPATDHSTPVPVAARGVHPGGRQALAVASHGDGGASMGQWE